MPLQIATVGLSTLLHHQVERVGDAGRRAAPALRSASNCSGRRTCDEAGRVIARLSPAACRPRRPAGRRSRSRPACSCVMMMSNSSSIAATKSITVRLSHSRSPAKRVASVDVDALLVERLDQRADAAVDFVAVHAVPISCAGGHACHAIAAEKRLGDPLVKRRSRWQAPREARRGAEVAEPAADPDRRRPMPGVARRTRRKRSTCCARCRTTPSSCRRWPTRRPRS